MQHHTASLSQVDLHYVRSGSGPPLLLLHGWPQTWFEFHGVIPTLAKSFDVIAPDMRGMGDSSKPADGYDAATIARDLFELTQQLELADINVVGHDLGGPPAYVMAATHRSLVRRLAIVEAPLPGVEVEGLAEAMQAFWHMSFHQAADMPEALIQGRERMYLTWFYRKFAYDKAAVTPAAIDEFVRCYAAPGGLRASLAHYRAMGQTTETIAKLSSNLLDIPCLAYGGERCLRDWPLKQMSKVASNVRGGIIERCGHWVSEERPDWFCDELAAFFKEI